MLMPTVNYLRVVGCEQVAAKGVHLKVTGYAIEVAREDYEGLSI